MSTDLDKRASAYRKLVGVISENWESVVDSMMKEDGGDQQAVDSEGVAPVLGSVQEPSFLDRLRKLNVQRVPLFGHAFGEDWSVLEWVGACLGECGEAINKAKKIRRGDGGPNNRENLVNELAKELADIVIYADLAAAREGIDLETAIAYKFNQTSKEVGFAPVLNRTTMDKQELMLHRFLRNPQSADTIFRAHEAHVPWESADRIIIKSCAIHGFTDAPARNPCALDLTIAFDLYGKHNRDRCHGGGRVIVRPEGFNQYRVDFVSPFENYEKIHGMLTTVLNTIS